MAVPMRYRNFATVIYPDSENTPEHWLTILEEFRIPILISPFHDKDINVTGEPKKPHYHVIITFEGKKSKEQVKDLFDQVGGVGLEVVNSLRGYARYLCHLDNPDKAQYDVAEVKMLSGIDFFDIIGLPTDRYAAISEMIDYCVLNRIYSYAELLRYAMCERSDWFRILCDSGTLVMKEFLKSFRWEAEMEAKENDARSLRR